VLHDPPKTVKQVKNWISMYREIPMCSLKIEWLQAARNITASLYGSEDPRASALSTLVRSVKKQPGDLVEPSDRAYKIVSDRHDSVARNTANSITAPSKNITAPSKNITAPSKKTDETLTETNETLNCTEVHETTGELDSDNIQHRGRTLSKIPESAPNASMMHEHEHIECLQHSEEGGSLQSGAANDNDLDLSGASGPEGRTPHPAPGSSSTSKTKTKRRKNKKYETEGKPEQPPEGFNPRQQAVWEALRTATFYVPGKGLMTAWQAVSDPVLLAAQLGGDAYPSVDVGLVHRLGNWTTQHKQRAKREVGRFLLNRFSTSQERGNGPQSVANTKTQGAHRVNNQPDLEERVARLSENRKGMQCNE
jgi:hypothetical protein